MQINCLHISANCNPKSNVVSFLNSQLIAFAYSDQIGIYSLSQNRIVSAISDRSINNSRVNCIAVYNQDRPVIVCGYDCGALVIFRHVHQHSWEKVACYNDETALTSISVLEERQNLVHIFTNNHGSVVKHLVFDNSQISLASSVRFPLSKIVQSLASAYLQNKIVLFMAGADQKIHFYEKPISSPKEDFIYRFSLSGHEDAVTKLTLVKLGEEGSYMLASSSKDGYIRLWKLSSANKFNQANNNQFYQITPTYAIYLQSVLISHESSVTSLSWIHYGSELGLLSCSLDSTICVWRSDADGRWQVASRLGQLVGNKNAFFEVVTDSSSSYIAALNYTGALLIWKQNQGKFVLRQCFTGHSDHVTGIDWNHSGHFLVTTSKDQTTRVIARHNLTNTFHQISRAQIHGYDINAVCSVKVKDEVIDVIACGADEKVIRILEPPACFANYLNTFTSANLHLFFNSQAEEQLYKMSKPNDPILLYSPYSEGGTQVLGLMTKMQRIQRQKITTYYEEEQGMEQLQQKDQDNSRVVDQSLNYSIAPHQDYLIKHTLWPEVNKLYGHPQEIYRLCTNSDSSKLASSCKAMNKDAAALIIWDTHSWQILKIIREHSFTVNGMEFSSDNSYFASVSKDRKLAVFDTTFELIYSSQPHLRAITCLSFHVSKKWLLTGSRDKAIKLHDIPTKSVISQLNFDSPVCSIAFCKHSDRQDWFAVGLSNGSIVFGTAAEGKLSITSKVSAELGHTQQVNSLKWNQNLLASCSNDHSVRIFEVTPNQ